MFGHKVRVPQAVLQDGIKPAVPPLNFIDNVSSFHHRMHLVVKMAGKHLTAVQSKIRWYYDRRAEPQVPSRPGSVTTYPHFTVSGQIHWTVHSGPTGLWKEFSELCELAKCLLCLCI